MAQSASGGGVAGAFRAAPIVLKIPLAAFAVLLLAGVVCIFARASTPGNVLFGAFGLAAAVLGLVLVVDLQGSAQAMARIADALRSGRAPFIRRRWTANGYRLLGGVYVVMGCVFAVVGWSGSITWSR